MLLRNTRPDEIAACRIMKSVAAERQSPEIEGLHCTLFNEKEW